MIIQRLNRYNFKKAYCVTTSLFLFYILFFNLIPDLLNYERGNGFRSFLNLFKPQPLTQDGADPDTEVRVKRDFIKQMMLDAWNEYEKYAWGFNELRPLSQQGWAGGGIFSDANFGLTIIESLDTLHIMGLDREFNSARSWIEQNFTLHEMCQPVSLFETNIRVVGGFLSAYALTSDSLFLENAIQVARKLLPAFNTTTGIPKSSISPCNGTVYNEQISLAEAGSLHLEFTYLSSLTQDPIFEDKVQQIRRHLYKIMSSSGSGLYKDIINTNSGKFESDSVSLGGNSDSFYEYLIKSWIQTGDRFAKSIFEEAIESIFEAGFLRRSKTSNLLYVGTGVEFTHLACFSGGMFALGSYFDNYEISLDLNNIGERITNTCHESYNRSKSGLGPETFSLSPHSEGKANGNSKYLLRPEVIESYFILYRLTGDSKYREWGWSAALAIEEYCKVGRGLGYSGIGDVDLKFTTKDDIQQSYFLAETLKYLYLLFSSPDLIDVNQWVFNTEGHPLPIKGENPMYTKV